MLDSLWENKVRTAAVVFSGALGVGFQVAVFGMVIVYARHFSSGDFINAVGLTFNPRNSIELLVAGGILVVILLLLSASFIYYARRTAIRMAREYEEFCARRVFHLLGEGSELFSARERGDESYLLRLVRSDARLAGRVLRRLLSVVIPGFTLVVTVVVLLYLETALSFLIAALGSVLLFYQYRVSRQAAQHSMRFEKLAPEAGAEYRALIQHSKHLPAPESNTDPADRLFAKGAVRRQLDAYEGRLRAVETSRLVSGVFMAVVVGLILLIMGVEIIRVGTGWGRLLVYVVALRFAMMGLQGVFSTITSINRFYPQVRRYYAFVQSVSAQDAARYPPRYRYTLKVEGETAPLPGSMERLEVQQGARLALVTPLELNRYTLAAICENLLGTDQSALYSALHSARYASTTHTCPNTSLREALGLSREPESDNLHAWFPDSERWAKAREQLSSNLDKQLRLELWDGLDPSLKFILALISAKHGECSWIFVQEEGLRLLNPSETQFYLSLFDDAICCIVYKNNLDRVAAYGEYAVAVMDEQRLMGLGNREWFTAVRGTVSEELATKGRKNGSSGYSADAEDDLDE